MPSALSLARKVLVKNGFVPDFGPEVEQQLAAIAAPAVPTPDVRDLRQLYWSSIDNEESRDLDQLEVAEQLPGNSTRVRVAIADVDALVPAGSPIDVHAAANSTSVYTGIHVFPMLPERLSTNLTSLGEGDDRLAVVVDMTVDPDGAVTERDVYRALVHNRAKLAYDDVGAWLESGRATPRIAAHTDLQVQLRMQDDAAQRLRTRRHDNGAIELETIEARPVAKNGRVIALELVHKTRARELIEDFMIASNVSIALFLERHGASGIRRVVREPERWSRLVTLAERYGEHLPEEPDSLALAQFAARRRAADPESFPDLSLSIIKLLGPGIYALDRPGKDPGGHFGLAAHDYSHATAPNRRYADLITQRLVKAVLAERVAPYDDESLADIAAHCTEREDAERKVERTTRKIAAALLLGRRIGDTFDAIVTGASRKGTWVRLLHPPAEGRVMHGEDGLDVGDRTKVRLISTDPERGWLDFEVV